jgi:hypothetical protein
MIRVESSSLPFDCPKFSDEPAYVENTDENSGVEAAIPQATVSSSYRYPAHPSAAFPRGMLRLCPIDSYPTAYAQSCPCCTHSVIFRSLWSAPDTK